MNLVEIYQGTKDLPFEKMLYCQVLYYTGARISEVSELTVQQIDFIEKVVILRTLKRRRKNIYRQIPIPDHLLYHLLFFISHNRKLSRNMHAKLWSFSSRTGQRTIKSVMENSKIEGLKARALGLRHAYAVNAAGKVPLSQVQRWMGHAKLETTALYLQVSGIEEREWAQKLWEEEERD